ncbi:MAG: molybdopterin molybdotransferase MoeA [Candidatus Didemnitutus sp.]|nr:molybdopterin molybdotransferase MoeA [Candidatus Didemnitutus sp.]
MTTIAQLRALIDGQVAPLAPQPVALADALGCVLAEPVMAREDQPGFDRSAIDGYAVCADATAGGFRLCGEILPGAAAPPAPAKDECWRIFTGSAVPETCGLVMQEDSDVQGERVFLRVAASVGLVRRRGSSIRAGQKLLDAGTVLHAGEIALLASAGIDAPPVGPRPRVVHVTTGREVVPTGGPVGAGQVRDVNGPLIAALLQEHDARHMAQVHVDERREALVEAVARAGDFDVLLVSGGASVGRHDNSRAALEALGFEVLVERVNSRPGKPLVVARRGAQWAFGLPGNPVAHYVTFQVFIARALARLAGRAGPAECTAPLAAGCTPTADARETFWPARFVAGPAGREVELLRWIDSGDVGALAGVDALVRIPAGLVPQEGDRVAYVPCSRSQDHFP